MNRFSNAAGPVVAVACLAQIASPSAAQLRTEVSAPVRYADINLASRQGEAIFEARVRRVANRLCSPDTRDLSARREAERCRAEVVASGRRQFSALRTSRDVQVASAAAIIMASK